MRRPNAALLAWLVILFIPAIGWSKGETAKIEIEGENLAAPIEITDSNIVKQFNIWNGPGVSMRNARSVKLPPRYLDPSKPGGRFIDWSKGKIVDRPPGLYRYKVAFYIASARSKDEVMGVYAVTYEFDPSVELGYMYLPGFADGSMNTRFIDRGVEGNWFFSSRKWEEIVRPLIENAQEMSGDPPAR
ncbi:hypothetical protein [Microbulbifer sp. TYP-18]|uniref:hypothetical protein n=1 Tax=Microbulbifer sp. TYP-18 TaxID=3230024 RepID=UPI0034C62C76